MVLTLILLARDLDDEFEESVKYAKTHTLPFVNLDKGKNILMIGGRCGGATLSIFRKR